MFTVRPKLVAGAVALALAATPARAEWRTNSNLPKDNSGTVALVAVLAAAAAVGIYLLVRSSQAAPAAESPAAKPGGAPAEGAPAGGTGSPPAAEPQPAAPPSPSAPPPTGGPGGASLSLAATLSALAAAQADGATADLALSTALRSDQGSGRPPADAAPLPEGPALLAVSF